MNKVSHQGLDKYNMEYQEFIIIKISYDYCDETTNCHVIFFIYIFNFSSNLRDIIIIYSKFNSYKYWLWLEKKNCSHNFIFVVKDKKKVFFFVCQ